MTITRFAPSPTGYLHIGGLRTALFSYLWARKLNGKFYLRIEDTDLKRNSYDAMKAIIEAFEWVGLSHDGEVVYQSDRFDLYKEYIDKLLKEDKAYYCYMSKDELDSLREEQMKNKQTPRYDNRYRDFNGVPPEGVKPVIRIKAPLQGIINFNDGVKGDISVNASEVDDFIIARSDGVPTYNFVVTIDDALMGITDVIRGDDHLSNTPKQIVVYEALNFKIPKFHHVPMILNPQGKKLSKRDGATDVMEYKKMGYMPQSLLNFLVRLGWSYGDQEIFSLKEMLELFNPNDINKSASAYNAEKLSWLNSHYIKNSTNEKLLKDLEMYELNLASHDKKEILLDSLKDRVKTLDELSQMSKGILHIPESYDDKGVKKAFKNDETYEILNKFISILESAGELHLPSDFEELFNKFLEDNELKFGKVGLPLRISLTGITSGISIMDIMAIIGKNESVNRIKKAIEVIKSR